jgi:DNA-binding NarL/FixJ family response regulator
MLLNEARHRFQSLGMDNWLERAEALIRSTANAPAVRPDGLTGREVEVLQLVAAGHTSKEIAAQLTVSVATIQRHIATIYLKIGAHGRADAAAHALRGGLLPLGPTRPT